MPASKAKAALTAERRTKLIRMRLAGIPFEDIAVELGYSSRGDASKDLIRALEQNRDEEAAEISTYRQQENERLDTLLHAAWPQATKPSPVLDRDGNVIGEGLDLRAVDTVLRLMDRRAKLNGLDMPTKAELSGPGGGGVPIGPVGLAELRDLIQTAGDPDDPDDSDDALDDEEQDEDADDDRDDA